MRSEKRERSKSEKSKMSEASAGVIEKWRMGEHEPERGRKGDRARERER